MGRRGAEFAGACHAIEPLPRGALLLIDGNGWVWSILSEADAAEHFVIANVRRPCDYWVSCWAFMSDQARRGKEYALKNPYIGLKPPYTSPGDRAHFGAYVKASDHFGYTPMALGRIGAWARPHCWVRWCSSAVLARCSTSTPRWDW